MTVIAQDRKVKTGAVTFHRKKNLQYFEISAKSNYNFEKPFLWLARKLVGCVENPPSLSSPITLQSVLTFLTPSNPTLEFVAAPALAPPEVQVDAALMEQYNKELQEVCLGRVSVASADSSPLIRRPTCPCRRKTKTFEPSTLFLLPPYATIQPVHDLLVHLLFLLYFITAHFKITVHVTPPRSRHIRTT